MLCHCLCFSVPDIHSSQALSSLPQKFKIHCWGASLAQSGKHPSIGLSAEQGAYLGFSLPALCAPPPWVCMCAHSLSLKINILKKNLKKKKNPLSHMQKTLTKKSFPFLISQHLLTPRFSSVGHFLALSWNNTKMRPDSWYSSCLEGIGEGPKAMILPDFKGLDQHIPPFHPLSELADNTP